ncbi:hypothetical protein GRI58_14275 [Porphyrobacter algicida]|uniref:Uncharacterized protein n=2 Tax=Qipengyuania algicida TaxID=1836209 RepID=A0A845ALD0_9SPHN|nr:hypothetical protein [Qipengyuania algicida]
MLDGLSLDPFTLEDLGFIFVPSPSPAALLKRASKYLSPSETYIFIQLRIPRRRSNAKARQLDDIIEIK